ncbi:Imm63 family immunity protein [Lysobacter hankyongensis]|uniref:Immunity protein 63 domain-containing protein n=1 Tax=Lysobacter hankyongensis TaxID=1176535 RepID=A0ABP9C825_9GAMM
MDRLQQFKQAFKKICNKIGHEWPLYAAPQHDGSPHVEISGDQLSYVVTERGSEFERRTTTSQDDLLYWLASDMVFSIAGHYELNHRELGRDSRRIMFARELELMGRINPAWRGRKEAEIMDILARHPYRDENEA